VIRALGEHEIQRRVSETLRSWIFQPNRIEIRVHEVDAPTSEQFEDLKPE
jgi:hypothetical protein